MPNKGNRFSSTCNQGSNYFEIALPAFLHRGYTAEPPASLKKTLYRTVCKFYIVLTIKLGNVDLHPPHTLSHTIYIPQPEDLDSMLELKPPLNPVPEPALGEPQPIAPEFEP